MPFRSSTSLMVQKGVDKRKEVELMKGKLFELIKVEKKVLSESVGLTRKKELYRGHQSHICKHPYKRSIDIRVHYYQRVQSPLIHKL